MDKRYKWAAEFIMIALFMWVIAGIITSVTGYILYDPPRPPKNVEEASSQAQKALKVRSNYEVIANRDLLKVPKAGKDTGERSLSGDVIRPLAEMGLTLRGTISGPIEIARAVIEEANEQKLFKIGDTVKGARVVGIFRNKVIMDVNGQEQMLVVEESKSGPSQPSGSLAGGQRMPRFPRMGALGSSGVPDVMKNMDQMLGNARVVPYYRGGQPYGFRISDVQEGAKIYQLGVRSGDIIKSVNGIPIRSPQDALNAYQELGKNTSVDLELERQGQVTRITVPMGN
jgi:general secretion pathway protein C